MFDACIMICSVFTVAYGSEIDRRPLGEIIMEQDTPSVTDSIPGSAPSDVIDVVPETIGAPSDVIDAATETIGAPPMNAQETLDAPQPETPETPKKRNRTDYVWPIGYVVFTTVLGPVLFIALGIGIISLIYIIKDKTLQENWLDFVIPIIPIVPSIVLLIGNIVRSFRIQGEDAPLRCVRLMLILKYGMIPFFLLHLCLLPFVFFIVGWSVDQQSFYPFMFIYLFVAPPLFMLPGAFYGIRVVRFSLREKKLRLFTAILHGIALFIPVLDVPDAAYLSAIKWKTARKTTAVVLITTTALIALIFWRGFDIGFSYFYENVLS